MSVWTNVAFRISYYVKENKNKNLLSLAKVCLYSLCK